MDPAAPANSKSTAAANAPPRPSPAWVLPLILLWTALVFSPALKCGFIHGDDDSYVTQNPLVAQPLSLRSVYQNVTTPIESLWHPLTSLGFHLQYQLFGLNPMGYHAVDVAFHLVNVALVYLLMVRLVGPGWRAALITLGFAINPLRMESVVWACELKDVGSVLFVLLSILLYLRWVERPRVWTAGLCIFCHLISLLFKPMFVTLPAILLLLDFWPLKRIGWTEPGDKSFRFFGIPWRVLTEKIPFLISALVVSIIVKTAGVQPPSTDFGKQKPPLWVHLIDTPVYYAHYLRKMLLIGSFSVDDPVPRVPWPVWVVVACWILMVGVSALATWYRRTAPWAFVGWWWFVLTLIPAIIIVTTGVPYITADRYTYVSGIGLMLMIPSIPSQVIQRRPQIASLGALLAVACSLIIGVTTFTLIDLTWSSNLAMFQHIAIAVPESSSAWNNLAVEEAKLGLDDRAIAHFRKCIELEPDMYMYPYNLGRSLAEKNTPESNAEALEVLQKSLDLYPRYEDAHDLRNLLLIRMGRPQEAAENLQKELQINGRSPKLWHTLGDALKAMKQDESAARAYAIATALISGKMH